jgi:hypothetical protein
MKDLCAAVGIDIKNRDIVNHSGRSIPITFLFQQGVPMATTMAITEHKSESLYRIYAHPSNHQKEEALSLLINNIGTLPLSNPENSEVRIYFLFFYFFK